MGERANRDAGGAALALVLRVLIFLLVVALAVSVTLPVPMTPPPLVAPGADQAPPGPPTEDLDTGAPCWPIDACHG